MAKPAEATLGYVSLNRFAVCDCSDFHVCVCARTIWC